MLQVKTMVAKPRVLATKYYLEKDIRERLKLELSCVEDITGRGVSHFITMAELPPEILVLILKKLGFKSLTYARRTCKLWKSVIDEFQLLESSLSKYQIL